MPAVGPVWFSSISYLYVVLSDGNLIAFLDESRGLSDYNGTFDVTYLLQERYQRWNYNYGTEMDFQKPLICFHSQSIQRFRTELASNNLRLLALIYRWAVWA